MPSRLTHPHLPSVVFAPLPSVGEAPSTTRFVSPSALNEALRQDWEALAELLKRDVNYGIHIAPCVVNLNEAGCRVPQPPRCLPRYFLDALPPDTLKSGRPIHSLGGGVMHRRSFLAGLVTIAAVPLVAEAQPAGPKAIKIGFL